MNNGQVVRLADTYVEKTDDQWDAQFHADVLKRQDRVENGCLTIEQLLAEQDEAVADAYVYFMGLTDERQRLVARQFKNELEELKELRQRYRALAMKELERRGFSCDG
jgi:hypothetical protein